ncbi:unnamed protein product, partial [Thlaspi arvense]
DLTSPLFHLLLLCFCETMATVDFENSFILFLLCLFSTFFLFTFFFKKPKNAFNLPPIPLLFRSSVIFTFSSLKISSKYGPFLHLHIFNVPFVLVSSASVAYEIFKYHDPSISSHGAVAIEECLVLGTFGFIKAPYGDYWKFMKKLITTTML